MRRKLAAMGAAAVATLGTSSAVAPASATGGLSPEVPTVNVNPGALPVALTPRPAIRLVGKAGDRVIVDGARRIRIHSAVVERSNAIFAVVSHARSGRGYVLWKETVRADFLLRVGPRGGVRVLARAGGGGLDSPRLVNDGSQILLNRFFARPHDAGEANRIEVLSAFTGRVLSSRVFTNLGWYHTVIDPPGPGLCVQVDDLVNEDNPPWIDLWWPRNNTLRQVISGVDLDLASLSADRIAYRTSPSAPCEIIANYQHPRRPLATFCNDDFVVGFSRGGGRMLTYPDTGGAFARPTTMTLRTIHGAPLIVYKAHEFEAIASLAAGFGVQVMEPYGPKHNARIRCRGTRCVRQSRFDVPFPLFPYPL